MVERTKIAALFSFASVTALLVLIAAYRFLEYVRINPTVVLFLAIIVFAFVWIYDAMTESKTG